MVFKRCKYDGCKTSPRCEHPWWIQVMVRGVRERGPVRKYLGLWPADRYVPDMLTKDAAKTLEAYVVAWVVRGRDLDALTPRPLAPPPSDDPTSPDTPPPPSRVETIGDACDAYAADHLTNTKDASALSIVRRMQREHGSKSLLALLDKGVVRPWLDGIEESTSVSTRNHYLARWKALLHWCQSEYRRDRPELLTTDSPFHLRAGGIRKKREGERSRRLSRAEERALVRVLERLPDGGMMLGRFYCALDAGLRRGEMLALTSKDIYQKPNVGLVLRIRWDTAKSQREREVPVWSKRLSAFLNERRFHQFTFGQADGTRVTAFRRDWERALVLANLEAFSSRSRAGQKRSRTKDSDLHWHDLRHECGSRLAERNVPLIEVMKLLGHADLKTTQKYLNATLINLSKNLRKVARAAGW